MIDETTPILFKVGNLKEHYWTWIHQPYEGKFRLFKSDFLELLTRTKWYIIPIIWLPLVIYLTVCGFQLFKDKFGLFHLLFRKQLYFSFKDFTIFYFI